MTKFLKKIAPFLILVSFLILSALLPEILGEDAKALAESYLGDNYKYILIAFFLLLFIFAAYINPDLGLGLFSKKDKHNSDRYNLPATEKNRQLLINAKKAVSEANHIEAIKCLSELNLQTIDIEISTLSARLAQLRRTEMQGTQSQERGNRVLNEISVDFLNLIGILEREIEEAFAFSDKIKAALKSRYENRLNQKLLGRQPVNLRLLPSTTGTTPQAASTFVQYSDEEIRKKLAEYYEDAKGRLLLIGVPGAGKTTLLLQLELELLEKETSRIPVILNLARWSSEFTTLEAWIQEILPSEMGLTINKKAAADFIAQNRLILLLDGLDEVKQEDRQTCLEVIGIYGEDPNRYFVISSRIDEYKVIAKDAPVNSQIEVGTLGYEQLIEQLEKTEQNEGSKRLLAALKEDTILREIAEVPFYFNTLQLLFARGRYLHEFNFSAQDVKGRKKEIEQNFALEMLRNSKLKGYDAQSNTKYLGFFASRFKRENLVDFELIHLQYNWGELAKWETEIGKIIEGIVVALVVGLFGGVFGVLIVGKGLGIGKSLGIGIGMGLGKGLGLGSGLGLGIGLGLGLGKGLGLAKALGLGIGAALGPGLGVGLGPGLGPDLRLGLGSDLGIGLGLSLAPGLLMGLLVGLSTTPGGSLHVLGLVRGLPIISTKEDIKWRWSTFSNKNNLVLGLTLGLILGLRTGLKAGPIVGLFVGLLGSLAVVLTLGIFDHIDNHNSFIQINDPYQRFKASAKVFYFSILQHWHLRHILYRKGLLPKKLVLFLNDMVECNILETTGASWRFRHRILQDYFADQWVETEFEPEQK